MDFEHVKRNCVCLLIVWSVFVWGLPLAGQERDWPSVFQRVDQEVHQLMEDGDIPGLTLVIVHENRQWIRPYGVADIETGAPVEEDTLFELGSCSKAFTALGVLKLESEGALRLDDAVTRYLPWFRVTFEGEDKELTLRHLLTHTSGIPWRSVDLIPVGGDGDALRRTVEELSGYELAREPGTAFEYATINYDVLGLIVQEVSGISYEQFMRDRVFRPLGLGNTSVGKLTPRPGAATGYKIGFFKPRPYDPPEFRGNNPAGYIVSNGPDMARWLGLQAGLADVGEEWRDLIRRSHQRNTEVPPSPGRYASYAMGWYRYVTGDDLVDHGGLNPNFTAYNGFKPSANVAVAVLANSNSGYTVPIGRRVMDIVLGEELEEFHPPGTTIDKTSSMAVVVLAVYLVLTMLFILSILAELALGRRSRAAVTVRMIGKLLLQLVVLLPFAPALYFLPRVLSNVSWGTATVWSPVSFSAAVYCSAAAMGLSYVGNVLSTLFPMKNPYLKSVPLLIILSFLAGGANTAVIFLITTSLFSDIDLVFQIYYFALAFFVYILGRKILQTRLVRLTLDIVYDMRVRLIEKIFLTSYQKFEKIKRGRVYATLNDDTGRIGNSANIFVGIITSVITTIGAFAYLATIAFWATMVTLGVVIVIATLYSVVSRKAEAYFEQARDTRNVYMGLLNGMIDGFKELSLRSNKKSEYQRDIGESCDEFRGKTATALIKFINAFLVGESLLIVVLGSVGFAIPRLFDHIGTYTLMSFIMVLLYLIGPVNNILNSIPAILQLRVAWNRVKSFIEDIPANIDPSLSSAAGEHDAVESLTADQIRFSYEANGGDEGFSVGPMDLEFKKGEITFIIGGNGSGKTTLAKLLTGLYRPEQGDVRVNGTDIQNGRLGEYFSAVFGGFHLFSKLYDVDLKGKEETVDRYLDMLNLKDKVQLENNRFSTIDLSGGQRKRLALLQCYLEDSPIYLFDEIAADQDPEFRKFFYRRLLPRMKEEGKVIIAITHDDHYFDVADKIFKMDMGKIEVVDAHYKATK